MRTLCTIIVLALLAIIFIILLPINAWLALVSFLLLLASFIYNGLHKIPFKPPHKAILVFLGKRQNVVLSEGWRFFPIYPFVFEFALIKVEKVNYDLEPQQVRTPDRAVISLSPSLTWIPGIKDEPESYNAYLNSGGEEGVKKIIHDIIEDRAKTWAGSNKEGPSTWMEAQIIKDDALEVLIKSLLGDVLKKIGKDLPKKIPTNTWMRFLDDPQSEPTSYDTTLRPDEKIPWAEKDENTGKWNWNGLKHIFHSYTKEQQDWLIKEINDRREAVRKIREGNGDFGIEGLGITLLRFTINEVKVEGEVAKAAELEEKEKKEKEADKVEIKNISDRAAELLKAHPGLTAEQAFELIQVERNKATRTIINVTGAKTDVGSDLIGLAAIARETFKEFKNSKQGNREKGSGEKGKDSEQEDDGDDKRDKKRNKKLREITQKNQDDLDEMNKKEE